MTTIIIDQPALTIPRKLSLSSTQGPLGSPRDSSLPSPRTRGPLNPGFDGILNSGETWVSRRRASESGTRLNSGATTRAEGNDEPQSASRLKIDEEEEEHHLHSESIDPPDPLGQSASSQDSSLPTADSLPEPEQFHIHNAVSSPMNGSEVPTSSMLHTAPHPLAADDQPSTNTVPATSASQPATNPASIEWSYLDPQGLVQGTI
jgi:PERQ amino acid-rich with GYF domain-containing protein